MTLTVSRMDRSDQCQNVHLHLWLLELPSPCYVPSEQYGDHLHRKCTRRGTKRQPFDHWKEPHPPIKYWLPSTAECGGPTLPKRVGRWIDDSTQCHHVCGHLHIDQMVFLSIDNPSSSSNVVPLQQRLFS